MELVHWSMIQQNVRRHFPVSYNNTKVRGIVFLYPTTGRFHSKVIIETGYVGHHYRRLHLSVDVNLCLFIPWRLMVTGDTVPLILNLCFWHGFVIDFMSQPLFTRERKPVESSWNVMAHGNAREGKWRGNWRMELLASTLHTTSEHGVSSITTADAHPSAASSRLNWRPSPV